MSILKQPTKHHLKRVSGLFIALLIAATIAPQILSIKPASADDGGYPWITATTLNQSLYDWGYSPCPSNASGCMGIPYPYNPFTDGKNYGMEDPYTMEFRNCTSYAAWKINLYFSQSFSGWGNAASWPSHAPAGSVHSPSSYTPVVGDLAQWGTEVANGAGHVAFVYAVDSTTHIASLDEYNVAGTGNFTGENASPRTTASTSAGVPDHYIHIGTVTSPPTDTSYIFNVKFDSNAYADFVTSPSSGDFTVAYGTSTGSLSPGQASLTNWSVPSWAGVADTNGDKSTDILVAQPSGGYALALGHTNGIFTEGGTTLPGWGTGTWAGMGNFYTNGSTDTGYIREDLAVANATGGFAVAYGLPNGTLAEGQVSLTNWTVGTWAGVGDFNGDGFSDILVAQPGGGYAIALGHSNGTFTEGGTTLPGWGTGNWVGTGNFYLNGSTDSPVTREDLVVANPTGGFAVAYGLPNGTLAEGPTSLSSWTVSSWAGTGDFDGNGYTDILVAQPGGGFKVALGHSNGIFTDGGTTLPGWGPGNWAAYGSFTGAKGNGYVHP